MLHNAPQLRVNEIEQALLAVIYVKNTSQAYGVAKTTCRVRKPINNDVRTLTCVNKNLREMKDEMCLAVDNTWLISWDNILMEPLEDIG